VFWKRENIDRWVELGARDTRAALGRRQTELDCEASPAVESPAVEST
jgi:hypothetical protein